MGNLRRIFLTLDGWIDDDSYGDETGTPIHELKRVQRGDKTRVLNTPSYLWKITPLSWCQSNSTKFLTFTLNEHLENTYFSLLLLPMDMICPESEVEVEEL